MYKLLEPLARHQVNMNRIESRPSRLRRWEYVFFVDVDGHAEEEPLRTAMAALQEQGAQIRVLGSYPRAVMARSGATTNGSS